MSLLIAADFTPAERVLWEDALQAALPGQAWAHADAPFDPDAVEVAIVANPRPASLQGLPNLKLIQSLWAGVDRLLCDPSLPADVPIGRLVDPAMSQAMAETALWAVLSLHRGHFVYAQQQREMRWEPLAQRRADEVRVLVLGLGQMGGSVAQRLAYNGYRVTGWSRHAAQRPGVVCRHGDDALPELLRQAQLVINLLPLTPATTGLFNARTLGRLPRGAGLVNLARGAHVVEADLLAALDSGQLAHAVLDVFSHEPLPVESALWRHPHVTVLPHVAALTDPRSAAAVVAANVNALRAGRPLQHLVDRQRGY